MYPNPDDPLNINAANMMINDIDKFMTEMAIAEYPLRHFVQFSMEVGTRPNELFGLKR